MKKYFSLTHLEVFLLTVVFTFVFFGLYFSLSFKEFFESVYTIEDGVLESLTVVFLLLGAFTCWGRFFRLKKQRPWPFLVCCIGLGLLFLFGAGEEISWGQRLLGVQSPEFFAKYNSQGETNLHNLYFGDFSVNKRIFGLFLGIVVAVYVLILPALYRRVAAVRTMVNSLAMPLPRFVHILFYLLLFVVSSLMPSGKKGEILEFGGCALFFMITLAPVNQRIFRRDLPFRPDDWDSERI